MEAHLVAHMHLAPKMGRIIGEVLRSINASAPPLPDGSGRKLPLRLTDIRVHTRAVFITPPEFILAFRILLLRRFPEPFDRLRGLGVLTR